IWLYRTIKTVQGVNFCTNRLVSAFRKEWNMKSTRVCALWRGLVLPVMALVSVGWLLPGEAVSQQQPKDKDKEKRPAPPTEMKVFQVKHVSARNLASTILQIWGNQGGFRATIDD